MHEKPKYLFTNWVDGMKINHSHFANSERAIISLLEKSGGFIPSPFSYGIARDSRFNKESLEIKPIKSDNNNYIVQVDKCFGITASGVIIDFDSEVNGDNLEIVCNLNELQKNSSKADTVFFVSISHDSHSRIPTGQPNGSEEPLRYPYVRSKYFLSIIPHNEIKDLESTSHSLIISKFVIQEGKLYLDESYVPPVTSMNAYPVLQNNLDKLVEYLNIIHISMYNIIFKVNNKHHKSPLAYNIKSVCEKVIYPLSSKFFSIHQLYKFRPPIEFVKDINEITFTLKLAIDFLPAKEKEDLLLYLKEWNEVSPSEFEVLLNNVINLRYSHEDISASIEIIEDLLEFLSPTFKRLSELDLIGKRKSDKNLVVKETSVKAKKGFRLID